MHPSLGFNPSACATGFADENVPRIASSASVAADWVKLNIQRYPGVAFRYIAVGNEITGSTTQNIVPAMRNLNAALSAARLSGIKVSTAVRMDVLAASSPPSTGAIRDAYMTQVVKILASTGAPLLANVYPYFAYTGTKCIDLNYALFKPGSTTVRATASPTPTSSMPWWTLCTLPWRRPVGRACPS